MDGSAVQPDPAGDDLDPADDAEVTAAADPDDDDLDDDEADDADDAAAAGAAGGSAGDRPARTAGLALTLLALAVVLAGAGWEGWLLYDHHRCEVAGKQALAAAESYALVLTSVDPAHIDENFTAILDGSTGDFKHMYAQASESLRQKLIENKATAHGTVVESAVQSATPDRVEVVLFIDQAVSNKMLPAPQIDRSRIVMTMQKVDGRWLASSVDMP